MNIETSGHGTDSYPIEITVALGNGQIYRSLVKPIGEWVGWNKLAEEEHGISRWELERFGKSPYQICLELNKLCQTHPLYSETWDYDNYHLEKLFEVADIDCEFQLNSIEGLIDKTYQDDWINWKGFIAQVLGIDIAVCHGKEKAKLAQTAIGLLFSEYGNNLDEKYSSRTAA